MTPFRSWRSDAAALVEKVNTTLMMGFTTPQLRQIILTATNAVPASDANQRALGAVYSGGHLERISSTPAAPAPAA
ncbi:MAG: hypothetical protein R2708_26795 [Vicinamibacterales bacterium]